MKKRKIKADDLIKMKFLKSARISPDESKIVFTVQVAAKNKKKYYSHLYIMNIDGGDLKQFTNGKVTDSNPIFSLDSKCVYFISKRGKDKGIFRIRTSGGEAEHWLGEDGSYSALSFSPDGKKLLCVFQKADDLPKDKDGKKEEPVYRHITNLFYKLDNAGFLPKDPGHVYVIDIKTRKARKITNGKNGERSPVWIGNNSVAYVSNIHKHADEEYLRDDIFVISTTGGKSRKLKKPAGEVQVISVSPDNKEIAFVGHDNPDDAWGVTPVHVWKLPVRGGGAVNLTPKLKRNTYDSTISDTFEGNGVLPPAWSADGKHIYFQVSENGSTRLYRVGSSGRGLSKVISGKIHVGGYSLDGHTSKIVTAISTHAMSAEIFVSGTGPNVKPRRISKLNDRLFKDIHIGKPEEVIVPGHDGYPIHAWILKPPNFSPNKKYPSILQIHGGPRVQYGNTFFHEMQYLAANGYVVYYGNPRGGQGYGEKHAHTIVDSWGSLDYEDCMSLAGYMSDQKYINKNKMGVTGGSYGGYMTSWIVTHTNFFKAAISQRGLNNFISFFGASDIGFAIKREIKGTPWNDFEKWWELSPIKHVAKCKTPLLIIHSEQDLRCPIEQGEQMYAALKTLKRKVEMVRFPSEPHGLSRGGRPDRRIARLEWIVKWFDKYLKNRR